MVVVGTNRLLIAGDGNYVQLLEFPNSTSAPTKIRTYNLNGNNNLEFKAVRIIRKDDSRDFYIMSNDNVTTSVIDPNQVAVFSSHPHQLSGIRSLGVQDGFYMASDFDHFIVYVDYT